LWSVGDPAKTGYWQTEPDAPLHLAPDTFHEITIPAPQTAGQAGGDLYDKDGMLTVVFYNPNNVAILFPPNEGMEVLYPEGTFAVNFARGLGMIFCWMALLAALGMAAASFLSFPVAAFFSLAMMIVVFSSGTMAEAVDVGTVVGSNDESGSLGHSFADSFLIPSFKGMLAIIDLAKNFSPIDSLSTGRSITWSDLGLAFVQVVLLLGGVFAITGIVMFSRRELATAQGTQ